ncbi:MAG: hypothetical protein KKD44_12280 [Proteobacteria bacterium]|nr:hypothetical protein [Pseudomonadota bacterium]
MKGISDIDKLGLVRPQAPGSGNTENNGDLFKKTFEKVLNRSAGQAGTQPSSATSGLGEIRSFGLRLADEGDDPLETGTDNLLTMLDRYSKALSDPTQSLKEIEPLLKNIKIEAEQLTDAVKSSDQANPALKSLAEKSALLANVEYVKFMRGDYV